VPNGFRIMGGGSSVSDIGGDDRIWVTFYGVRGSTPCHGPDTARYGGNTSCVVLRTFGEDPLVLDLGTGLRYFGDEIDPRTRRVNALVSHLHWDHIQGLPFFSPMLRSDVEIGLWAPRQPGGRPMADILDEVIAPPAFPISLSEFPATVSAHAVADETFEIGGWKVTSRFVPHVGPTLGFRVEHHGRVVAYIPDLQEPVGAPDSVGEAIMELAADADLLIHDSQYTEAELAVRPDWGHCTVRYAMSVAQRAEVRKLVLFHHDPARGDDDLDALVAETTEASIPSPGCPVVVAREGLCVAVS
jgi:phosphoribosyl 1,2-cyclic phosphodiesterase